MRGIRLSPSGIFIPVALRFMAGRRRPDAPALTVTAGTSPATIDSITGIRVGPNESVYVEADVHSLVAGGATDVTLDVVLTPTAPAGAPTVLRAQTSAAVAIGQTAHNSIRERVSGLAKNTYTVSYTLTTVGAGTAVVAPAPSGSASLFVWLVDDSSAGAP